MFKMFIDNLRPAMYNDCVNTDNKVQIKTGDEQNENFQKDCVVIDGFRPYFYCGCLYRR